MRATNSYFNRLQGRRPGQSRGRPNVLLKFMQDHLEDRHLSAASLAIEAFTTKLAARARERSYSKKALKRGAICRSNC
jgi:hypothetical protein